MNYSTCKPIDRPPARKPRSKHGLSPSVLAEHQGSRVRVWLAKNAGLLCIAFGWVFAFAPIAAKAIDPTTPTDVESFLAACFLFGFGLAWVIRSDCDRRWPT